MLRGLFDVLLGKVGQISLSERTRSARSLIQYTNFFLDLNTYVTHIEKLLFLKGRGSLCICNCASKDVISCNKCEDQNVRKI
jgi:hypothetical protein